MWASPSDIAAISAQPYKPKSPPTIPYVEEKKAKQQKKLTVWKYLSIVYNPVLNFYSQSNWKPLKVS